MCIIANSTTSRATRKLQPLQNRAVKIILGINRYVSTEEMKDLDVQLFLMNLAERRKMFMLKMMFKYSKFEDCVDHRKPKIELRTRPKVKMKTVFTKKERVFKSPYYLCNKLWDQLTFVIQNLNTCNEFSSALRQVNLAKFEL